MVSAHEEDVVEGPPIAIDVGVEIFNSVTNEVVKAVALLSGVDPMTASAMGGGAAGMITGLGGAFQRAYERRRTRALIALGAARQVSGLDPGDLLEHALEDDRKLELLAQAFEISQREADEQRVRFYGRIAASGILANDDAAIDAYERIFTTIASLDAADLKVLLHMASKAHTLWSIFPQSADYVVALSTELPELGDMLEPIVYRLLALGLMTDRDEEGHMYFQAYVLSPFARRCVETLLAGGSVENADDDL